MDYSQANECLAQIGRINVACISGGLFRVIDGTLVLPVSNGYSVEIDLDPSDTYTVRRVFRRSEKRWVKGEVDYVYCDQIGEVAYRASCFRDDWAGARV
jgi:hypothetical protein